MVVGMLEMSLRLDSCHSLKEKRRLVRSLIDKARRQFQVSVAEVDDVDLWQNATVGVAVVSNNAAQAECVLTHAAELFEVNPAVEVIVRRQEIMRW